MTRFHCVCHAQEIIFGAGAVERLGETVARYGWRRIVLCTTRSVRANGWASQAEAALGGLLAATFEPVQQHVPDHQVAEATAFAADKDADAILGIGGGSPIGMAKAVAAALEEIRTRRPARAAFPTDQPLVPVIAIPTTYAGSEMTPVYGVTRHDSGPPRKVTVADPKIAPKVVVYDPQVTLDLPSEQTASTGINALAHCIETLYSSTRSPLASAAAVSGVRHIAGALPRCYKDGHDLEARTQMLAGAHLAGAALAGAGMALHHGLCHVLGGSAGVPHGVANAIVLPHAIRFNLPAVAPLLVPAAEAVGLEVHGQSTETAVEALARWVDELVAGMGLARRLREVGVAEDDLPRLAQLALQSRAVQSNPRPVRDVSEIESLLREMW